MGEAEKISFRDFKNQHKNLKALREKVNNKKKKNFTPSAKSMKMKYWKPGEVVSKIKLTPYKPDDPFYTYYSLFKKVGNRYTNTLCNCHSGAKDLPCVPCYYALTQEDPELLPKHLEAITTTLLENFHKFKKTSKAGNEYHVYEKCKGRNAFGRSACEHCDNEVETVFGQHKHWSLGSGHMEQLSAILDNIESSCSNCNEGTVFAFTFVCPECDHVVASHGERYIDPEEEHVLKHEEVICENCEESIRCRVRTKCLVEGDDGEFSPGCDNPTYTSPWDCEISIKTEGKGASTSLVYLGHKLFEKPEEMGSWLLEPMPFDEFFRTMPLSEQAENLGKAMPFSEADEELLKPPVAKPNEADEYSQPRNA